MPRTLPDTNIWEPWVLKNNGILAERAVVSLGFTSDKNERILIRNAKVRTVSCDVAPSGLYLPPGGAGDTFDRLLSFSLDSARNKPTYYSDTHESGTWQFPFWFSKDDAESLSVYVETWDGDYTFVVDLTYEYKGEVRTIPITNTDGKPFRLVGPGHATKILHMRYGNPAGYEIRSWQPRRLAAPTFIHGWTDRSTRACKPESKAGVPSPVAGR
jgi:hypothetical protein